jgi:hypothetical protein
VLRPPKDQSETKERPKKERWPALNLTPAHVCLSFRERQTQRGEGYDLESQAR